jgi:hypothetical protein
MAHKSYLLAICAALSACASGSGAAESLAHLTSQNAEVNAEIASVMIAALHREYVAIAPNAFVTESSIMISPVYLDGRETRPPEVFSLHKRGRHCFLRLKRTGEEWELKHAQCVAVTTGH